MILFITSLVIIIITCCDKIISQKHTTQTVITNYTLIDLYSNPFQLSYKPRRRFQNEFEDLRSSALLSYKMMMIDTKTRSKTKCNGIDKIKHKDVTDSEDSVFDSKEWKKNFASSECGAKIVRYSDNVRHAHHAITRNADEYLLYQCQDPAFFVVELCETIKVIRLELDNYELYSGTPANFTVRTADKYSNNLNEWIVIGNFVASNEKMMVQHFSGLTIKSFGKFVRVDLETFHGTEHYCTLTSFRVFGMTEYECLSMNEENDESKFGDSGSYMTESLKIDVVDVEDDQQDHMTYFSQKYYFLQIRDDICVEKIGIQTVQSQSVIKGKEPNKPLNQVSNQKHKESVLISLSNKVKILEKNYTAQQSNLRSLETTSGQTNADVKKILKSLVKADESFQDSAKDSERMKGLINAMSEKVYYLETELGRLEKTMFIAVGLASFIILLVITFIQFISCLCSSEESKFKVDENEVKSPSPAVQKTTSTIAVQTDPTPPIVKKVTFPDEINNSETSKNDDISSKIFVSRRRKDLSRRVTWCSGTFDRISTSSQKQKSFHKEC